MKTLPGCQCGAPAWDCVCGDALVEVGKTATGFPVNAAGEILTHLCTTEQRRALNDALIQPTNFLRRQAS